jgi:zinc transport system substrate-binding protein
MLTKNKIFIALLLSFFLFTACGKKESAPNKPQVLVSLPPYLYFVERIAGDSVSVATLVPPGSNPHTYEPTPKEVERAFSVALWVRLGESYDQKILHSLREHSPKLQVVDITKGIALLHACEHHHAVEDLPHCHGHDEGRDLHIWLSPRLARIQAQTIADALEHLLPENRETYRKNLQKLLEDLDLLDQEITQMLEPMRAQAILVAHPAFGYFCLDYHLVQLSIEFEGKEPLPQHISQMLSDAKQYKIKSVFAEPQYSTKGAELVAEKLQLPVYMVDPYSSDYINNLRSIATIIARP